MSTHGDPESLKIAWLVLLVISGQVGIPILLGTLFFSRLRRLPTLHGLLVTWFVASFVCCLLFYANDAKTDVQPAHSLCLAQASLVGATPLTGALSAFSLVYDGWITVQGKETLFGRRRLRTIVLLSLPWVGFVAAAIALFVSGHSNPTGVRRQQLFYCTVDAPNITNTLGVLTIIGLTITALYGGKIALMLRRRWTHFKARVSDSSAPERHMSSPYVAIRIGVFASCMVLSLILMLIGVLGKRSQLLDILFALIPAGVLVIFGTQADVIRVWVGLFPTSLLPRQIRAWGQSKPAHSSPTLPTSHPISHTNTIDSTDSDSFDLSKEKYGNLEQPMTVHLERDDHGEMFVMAPGHSRA